MTDPVQPQTEAQAEAPKKSRGRPKGSFNKATLKAAAAHGLEPGEYLARKRAKKL